MSSFPTSRNQIVAASGLSVAWLAFGPKAKFKIPILDLELPASADPSWVFLAVLTYLVFRLFVDWKQQESGTRRSVLNRVDLAVALVLAMVAIIGLAHRLTDDSEIWRLSPGLALIALVLGEVVALLVSVIVFALRFVRSRQEAAQKMLPRVPVATMAQLRTYGPVVALLIAGFSTWNVAWTDPPITLFLFAIFVSPTLLHLAADVATAVTKTGPNMKGLKRAFDQHDASRTLPDSPPPPEFVEETTRALSDEEFAEVRAALEAGMSPDMPGARGWTPLMLAAANGDARLLDLYLEYGGNVNAINSSERAAIHYAAGYGNLLIVNRLLEAGATLEFARSTVGGPPLMAAARGGHLKVVESLLAHGADPTEKDVQVLTALAHAERNGFGDVAKALRNAERSFGSATDRSA